MVAMFSWFCADPIIQNCYRRGTYGSEYYYLLFSSSSESTSTFLSNEDVNAENNNNNDDCEWSNWTRRDLQRTLDNNDDVTLNNDLPITFDSLAHTYTNKYKKFGKNTKEKMPKAASEPPSENRIHICSEKRKSLHQLFPIFGVKRNNSNKYRRNTIKDLRLQNFLKNSSKVEKIMVRLTYFCKIKYLNYLKLYKIYKRNFNLTN